MLWVTALLVAPAVASNAGTPKEEIEHLIAHLGSSGCRFHRNGSWYTAERAVSHLTRKYAHLRERSLVPTAEAFIERAASGSSVSGKPYLVKCGGAPAVPSARWLGEELARFRAERAVPDRAVR